MLPKFASEVAATYRKLRKRGTSIHPKYLRRDQQMTTTIAGHKAFDMSHERTLALRLGGHSATRISMMRPEQVHRDSNARATDG